jgi:hypothetical protein
LHKNINMKHKWTYANIGGNTRVVIKSGKDIAHLGELDEKLWTVLACPVSGLEIADESLAVIDHDNDKKIHVLDVVRTAEWLCQVLVDAEVLLKGDDRLHVEMIKDEEIKRVAASLAHDGVVTLSDVKAAIAGVSVDMQVIPAAPYAEDVIDAYKACAEVYAEYFKKVKLQSLGLVTIPADAPVPGMVEEQFVDMGKKISEWETEKAVIEGANAKALGAALEQYKPLERLLLLNRDFCVLLRNFVSFQDFYAKRTLGRLSSNAKGESPWAIFQAGTLVIDQRACNLCLRVNDMAKHNAQAPDSGMFLIYCQCTKHTTGEKMQIVAAMTVGDVRNLKVGKNALFYDRQGRDWEAEVVKIVDNPISIGQAFWSPYRKLGDWVSGLITKSAEEKEKKSFADMTAKLQTAPTANNAPAAAPFDMAKFAGIFAAIGLAIGSIGTFLTNLWGEVVKMHAWSLLIVPVVLLLVSGPSMVLAWMKLRRRNLAPLLNANGWAMNADAIVSVLFGNTLTEQAQYPLVKLQDPHAKINRLTNGGKWAIAIAALVVGIGIAVGVMYWLGMRLVWCTC